jgi:hypothetical protein
MLMDFDHHRMDRRALGIAFKPGPMRTYTQDMNRIFAEQLKDWRGDMLFYPAIKQLTLDVAASSFLGIPLGPEADKINKAFVDMVQASVAPIRAPLPFTPMGRGVAGRKYLIGSHFNDNPASGKVLRKLGFQNTGKTALRHSNGRVAVGIRFIFRHQIAQQADGGGPVTCVQVGFQLVQCGR